VIEHGVSGFWPTSATWTPCARYAIDLLSDESALRAMGNAPAPPPQLKFCSSRLFRFTKIFTSKVLERSAQLAQPSSSSSGLGRIRQAQPDERASALAIFDDHTSRVAVEHLQTFRDIFCHADAPLPNPRAE